MIQLRWVGVWTWMAAVALGMLALADGPSAAVPADELARLIDRDAKSIQQALAKGKLTKRTSRRVRATALLIAHYAQAGTTKDNAAAMATLRDQALKLLKAVEAENAAEAKRLAAGLSSKPKADPNAKPEPVALNNLLGVENVMRVFSSPTLGGYGLEKELDDLVEVRGALQGDKQQRAIDLANKLTLIGKLVESYVPAKDEAKDKTRKNWTKFAGQLRQTAAALAEATRSGRDIGIAANNVSVSCTKCHDVFKPPLPGGQ